MELGWLYLNDLALPLYLPARTNIGIVLPPMSRTIFVRNQLIGLCLYSGKMMVSPMLMASPIHYTVKLSRSACLALKANISLLASDRFIKVEGIELIVL